MEDTTTSFDRQSKSVTRGSYTANLLGNIRGHLAGLQGYDIMALELIQNADDAKAHSVTFDITDDALIVWNSGSFTYCGDMTKTCRFLQENGYSCDFHRIADVGSGGKLAKSENIGRFGIGFVSTYQVTDHPEIHSSGIKLQLIPEEAQYECSTIPEEAGTKFVLPWARDPASVGRREIGATAVRAGDINQLELELLAVLRRSLLFLRHIKKAEVRRNGRVLLCCELERPDESSLILTYSPEQSIERWHIIRGDAVEEAAHLAEEHELLKTLNRSSKFSIALNMDAEYPKKGLLYAFLPTEQSTGLPLHINADFFPEADRKALIFSGNQHARYWNEMLIQAAAKELARDPVALSQMIGAESLWRIIHQAFQIAHDDAGYPASFNYFWSELKDTVPTSRVLPDTCDELHMPGETFLPKGSSFSEEQKLALGRLNVRIVNEALSPYRNTLTKVGVSILTLEQLVPILSEKLSTISTNGYRTTEEFVEKFWIPLWSLIDELVPSRFIKNRTVEQLKSIRFLVSEDLYTVSAIDALQCKRVTDTPTASRLLKNIYVCHHKITEYSNISNLVKDLDLQAVAKHLSTQIPQYGIGHCLRAEEGDLRDLYDFFADIDAIHYSSDEVYSKLRGLPIWSSSQGLIKASIALLPGNFEDPTGKAALLDTRILSAKARTFVSEKLGVKTQSISAFVERALPTFFDESGPLDEDRYGILIRELSSHPELLDHTNALKTLKSLPILPTQDGGWSKPCSIYARTEQLEEVLGNVKHLWLDFSKLPVAQSVKNFVESLGVLQTPAAKDLVERLQSLAESGKPDEATKKLSAETFYTLCEISHQKLELGDISEALSALRTSRCLPAKGDSSDWYYPCDLYAPYRSEGFDSQAAILDFRNTARLKTEVLEAIGVKTKVPTSLVVSHLQHCMTHGSQPHETCYRILNERAKEDEDVAQLKGSPCIYVSQVNAFEKPSKIYWSPQQLGRFAYRVPSNLESLHDFFDVVGVKDSPEAEELIEILLEIVTEYFEQSKPITGADSAVYQSCLKILSDAQRIGELEDDTLGPLQRAPSIVNLNSYFVHPDEVLLHDSEWLSSFFGGNIDAALCKLDPEFWSLAYALGVERLSSKCELKLDSVTGNKQPEENVAAAISSRARVIQRLFLEKPRATQEQVRSTFSNLTVHSVEKIYLQAIVEIDGQEIQAPLSTANAFFQQSTRELIVTRPINDGSWATILASILHHLMPEESGGSISSFTLNLTSLLHMSPEVAESHLTNCGYPLLPDEPDTGLYDLTSQELGEIGHSSTEQKPDHEIQEPNTNAHQGDEITGPTGQRDEAPFKKRSGKDSRGKTGENLQDTDSEKTDYPAETFTPSESDSRRSNKPKQRAKHKEQWDRRLLSYVNKKAPSEHDDTKSSNEHNLAIEVIARRAVCNFEKRRGRVPTEMPQTHPGYDIESVDPETGESRMIEVKGVNGEWNQTGVGLSSLQFDYAKKYTDSYWLYVVEFVSDSDNIRVHPIQDPASQVTSFMFDRNWRDAAIEEVEDPTASFIPGAWIQDQNQGTGEIIAVQKRGAVKMLTVQFEGRPQPTKNVAINIHQMKILDPEDGNNPS